MKGLVITTEGVMRMKDFGEPLYQTVGEVVGGYIEIVHPYGLEDPLVMIVNEEGLLKGLSVNPIASYLYRTQEHGHPIVGNAVIMQEGMRDGEPDIIGLEEEE